MSVVFRNKKDVDENEFTVKKTQKKQKIKKIVWNSYELIKIAVRVEKLEIMMKL